MYREQLLLPMNWNKPSNHFLQPLFGVSIFFCYTLYMHTLLAHISKKETTQNGFGRNLLVAMSFKSNRFLKEAASRRMRLINPEMRYKVYHRPDIVQTAV